MYRFKKFLITGVYLYLLLIGTASSVAGQYRFDTWTTDNGLPQNGVRQITQTPDGYLWFTTFDGLVRFDGVRFTTFNKTNTKGIINNRFTGIFADNDGTVYATTMEDGVLTIYRNGVFSSLTSEQVPGLYINHIERDASGDLRVLTLDQDRKAQTWYRLKNDNFEFIGKKSVFERDKDLVFNGLFGTQWTITATGVRELRSGKSRFYPIDMTKVNFDVSLFEDSEGNLWIGEYYVHRLSNGVLRTFGSDDGLPVNTIFHAFWQEKDGSIWCSSGGGSRRGVGLIQIKDDGVSIWGGKDQIGDRIIHSVFTDREGTTWLGTDRGLSRRRKQVIQSYSSENGIDHSEVYPLFRDRDDNIWVGTSKGLNIYRNGKFEALKLEPPKSDPRLDVWRDGIMSVQALWEDPNGKMWVGLNGGIFLVENGKAERLTKGEHVNAIKGDRFGNVWVATNTGLLRFIDYKLTAEYSTKDGLPKEFMTFIFEDSKGTLWFGGFGGLTKYEDGKFTNYTSEDGLTGNYVRTIYEDSDGAFWIGTYDEGLSRFKEGSFVNYRQENGLYNNGVFAIEEDEAGYFWISSNRDIYRVKKQQLNDFADGKIDKINSIGYGKEDGMLSTECNGGRQPASIRDKDGKFWFPTQDGVAIVDPSAEQENITSPSAVIEDILIGREPIDFRKGATIEPGEKDIEIHYTGISLIKSNQIKFKYKLEGHDRDWIDAGTRRTANYSYLPPGEYTFRVKASNSDGVWSDKSAETKIEMRPYFYQTAMFYALIILGAAIVLLIVWKTSVYQLEAREKRLRKLVAERTAELALANENLHKQANSDGLTKIGNRRRFESFLTDEWHRAVRFKAEISLVLIDIDHFKLFNDTYGHQAGDECLQRVAQAFADTIKRPTDLVARFGGEEFTLVLGGTDAAGALNIAEQAVANILNLQIPHAGSGTSEFLTVSAGIATLCASFDNSETDLIKAADKALYHAKKNGRNRIEAFDHLTQTYRPVNILDQNQFELT